MDEVSTIGIDLAKHVFQLHGVDGAGRVVLRRRLRRSQVASFFAALPPCVVGIEACGTAHFWARQIAGCGHDVRLMPPGYVKPYVKRNKHDAADAEAVCEAVHRPSMRFVPVKTAEQQAVLVAHSVRDLLVRQRTMLVNALRGHLAEFGIVAPRGIQKVDELAAVVADESDGRLPASARNVLRILTAELAALEQALATAGNRHCMVCLHHHPVPMSSRWLDRVGLTNAAEFLHTIDAHRNVRAIVWGHVHQTHDSLRKGVRLLATPSTCAQFLPHSDDFAVDPRPPAYRTFELRADGSLLTEVVWVAQHCGGSSRSACSAA